MDYNDILTFWFKELTEEDWYSGTAEANTAIYQFK